MRNYILDTSHPQLFSAYSPYQLEFAQVEGLVFEDPYRDPPVTRAHLYQEDPELKAVTDGSTEQELSGKRDSPLTLNGRKNPLEPVTAADFRAMVASWTRSMPEWRNSCEPKSLDHLCAFHARVFSIARDDIPPEDWNDIRYLRTLHTLWHATKIMAEHRQLNVFNTGYLISARPRVRERLKGLLKDSLADAQVLF